MPGRAVSRDGKWVKTDGVDATQPSLAGRHVQAGLAEHVGQANGAGKGRLAAPIRAAEHPYAGLRGGEGWPGLVTTVRARVTRALDLESSASTGS